MSRQIPRRLGYDGAYLAERDVALSAPAEVQQRQLRFIQCTTEQALQVAVEGIARASVADRF